MKVWINLACISIFGIYLYFMYDNPKTTLTNIIAFIIGWLSTDKIKKKLKKRKILKATKMQLSHKSSDERM